MTLDTDTEWISEDRVLRCAYALGVTPNILKDIGLSRYVKHLEYEHNNAREFPDFQREYTFKDASLKLPLVELRELAEVWLHFVGNLEYPCSWKRFKSMFSSKKNYSRWKSKYYIVKRSANPESTYFYHSMRLLDEFVVSDYYREILEARDRLSDVK